MNLKYWINELENTKKVCNTFNYFFPQLDKITTQLIKLYYAKIDLIDSFLINSDSNYHLSLLNKIEKHNKKINKIEVLYLKQKIDCEKALFEKVMINIKKPKKIID